MTKTTAGESTMISPSSPKAVNSVLAKSKLNYLNLFPFKNLQIYHCRCSRS